MTLHYWNSYHMVVTAHVQYTTSTAYLYTDGILETSVDMFDRLKLRC